MGKYGEFIFLINFDYIMLEWEGLFAGKIACPCQTYCECFYLEGENLAKSIQSVLFGVLFGDRRQPFLWSLYLPNLVR